MLVVAGWLLKQSINTRPWEADASYASSEDFSGRSLPLADAKLGLFVFLAVITSLFSLFISAYLMRMQLGDWRPLAGSGFVVAEHGRVGPQQYCPAMGASRCQRRAL